MFSLFIFYVQTRSAKIGFLSGTEGERKGGERREIKVERYSKKKERNKGEKRA
jgi:hypothetical protein